jgi:micrococcal nuclease
MKFILGVLFLFNLIINAEEFMGEVVSVSDGDTIKVLKDKKQIKIRLFEIDAPEMKQSFGKKSKAKLSDLIFKKTVKVVFNEKDKFGRTLGIVFLDGLNINEEMIRSGYAWVYKRYSNKKNLRDLQEDAKKNKLGLWTENNPTPPWEFRKENKF